MYLRPSPQLSFPNGIPGLRTDCAATLIDSSFLKESQRSESKADGEIDFIRLVVSTRDGSNHDIELLPVRTVEECFQLVTGLACDDNIEAGSGSQKIDLDHLIGSFPHKTVVFQRTRKRKEPSKYESALLEIVTIEGSIRFLPTKFFGTAFMKTSFATSLHPLGPS